MNKISAVIITLNEEANIKRCLDSLKNVSDEILVFDSHSVDRTVEIAKSCGAKAVLREWKGYAQTKNEANAGDEHDYILWLDADEALSDELKSNILQIKSNLSGAYTFNRLNNYCGKWIKHGGFYPDRKVRLFNRNEAKWEGDFVHEKIVLNKKVEVSHVEGDVLHYSYRSIQEHLTRIEKYSSLGAQQLIAENARFKFLKMIFNPAFRFVKNYFFRVGFLDGYYGLHLNLLTAYEVFLKYRKAVFSSGQPTQ